MKYLFQFLIITCSQSFPLLVLCKKNNEKRFIIVSNTHSGILLYPDKIQKTKLSSITELGIEGNVDRRRQICEDILSSYLFHKDGEYPYEQSVCCFTSFFDSRVDCPYRTIFVGKAEKKLDELVFVCLACRCGSHTVEYYISKEYNLDADSDSIGRFIFKKKFLQRETVQVHGLAELPGTTYFSPDLDIESLYVERKKKFSIAYYSIQDELCKLNEGEKQRICAAVFNSKYFVDKIFMSPARKVEISCELKNVSFQSERGETAATERRFREWMLHCKPSIRDENDYYISHAYATNQIFSYFSNSETVDDVFPENLTTNVRLYFSSNHRPWMPGVSEEDVHDDYELSLKSE